MPGRQVGKDRARLPPEDVLAAWVGELGMAECALIGKAHPALHAGDAGAEDLDLVRYAPEAFRLWPETSAKGGTRATIERSTVFRKNL